MLYALVLNVLSVLDVCCSKIFLCCKCFHVSSVKWDGQSHTEHIRKRGANAIRSRRRRPLPRRGKRSGSMESLCVSGWCRKARHSGDVGVGNGDARDTGCRRGRPFERLGASILSGTEYWGTQRGANNHQTLMLPNRQEHNYTSCPNDRRLTPPRPTPEG